jgi:general secretion pathway protein A
MLLPYFGFQFEPFGASPDPRCLYPSLTHREALASLKYGFNSNRGFTALIASPGMGKTTLLFRFLEDVRESARTVFLFDIDPACEPQELVAYILRDIGVTPGQSSSEMHQQFSDALVKENRAGRKFVVVIDEAQNLSDAVLERVRLLSNFETPRGKLLQIVLAGQPQLSDKLMQASLEQLRQRVSTICHLDRFSAKETAAYIDFRLKQAGYDGKQLFTDDALKLISEVSQGVPRIINNLCFNSLSLCRALNRKQVDDSMVSEVIADLELTPQPREPIAAAGGDKDEQLREPEDRSQSSRHLQGSSRRLKGSLAWAAPLVLCAVGILGLVAFRTYQYRESADEHSLDQNAVPTSVPEPVAESAGATIATEPTPNTAQIEITVKAGQSLRDIAVQYLGGFDLQFLHQIQALNPALTNPDHIEIGQKIILPARPGAEAENSATTPTIKRTLP